jgi:hypothetical protein
MEKTHNANINAVYYYVACIAEFASRHEMDEKSAYNYLSRYGGIDFLVEMYEIEHTLGIDETIEDMAQVCRNNGGTLE